MVPIKNDPDIRLKLLITLFSNPPSVHLSNIFSITTINEAKISTGVYFLNSFFRMKKTVNQGLLLMLFYFA